MALAIKGLSGLRARSPQTKPMIDTPVGPTYARFFGLTFMNPLTVVYFAALVLGASVTIGGPMGVLAFTIGAFVASLSWQLLLAAFGSWAGKTLSHRAQLATAVLGNGMILVLGGMAISRALAG